MKELMLTNQAVARGAYEAGGKGALYFATDICDGMAQGHDGINYSLPSRDIIADLVEIHANATTFDGGVFLSSCDKAVPAHLINPCLRCSWLSAASTFRPCS